MAYHSSTWDLLCHWDLFLRVMDTIKRKSVTSMLIFAFIAPVAIVFLVNICFFIMAARISWLQIRKKKTSKNVGKVVGWLKSSVSLVVVLGLTWITGVAVVEVEALYPLVYIYTIMAAFQGLCIFLALVVFSKAMIEDTKKLGRSDKNRVCSRVVFRVDLSCVVCY